MNTTVETARRVRALAPGPETAAAVRQVVEERPDDLAPFLEGMLAALEPGSVLAKARELSAEAERRLDESEARPAAEASRPCRTGLTRDSSREDVVEFCRNVLGLREDGEAGHDAGHRRKYIGTFEDRTEEGDGVWIFFGRKPKADVRSKLKPCRETGWRYMGKNYGYGWRHLCGQQKGRTA